MLEARIGSCMFKPFHGFSFSSPPPPTAFIIATAAAPTKKKFKKSQAKASFISGTVVLALKSLYSARYSTDLRSSVDKILGVGICKLLLPSTSDQKFSFQFEGRNR